MTMTQSPDVLQDAALREALEEARRAIGDHFAPNDCYSTGPVTGNAFRDLVECPACTFIAKYDALEATLPQQAATDERGGE